MKIYSSNIWTLYASNIQYNKRLLITTNNKYFREIVWKVQPNFFFFGPGNGDF